MRTRPWGSLLQQIYCFILLLLWFGYILVCATAVLVPISGGFSILILLFSVFLAVFLLKRYFSLLQQMLCFFSNESPVPKWLAAGLLGLLPLILLLAFRPTVDLDPMFYHLPLAKITNATHWYPGIGRMNSHFALPNGTGVIASLFTASGIKGFENIPTLLFWWLLLVSCVFIFLGFSLGPLWSLLASLSIVLVPDFLGQAYNMGTDLPQAFLLGLGLWAWYRGSWSSAFFYLSFGCAFKTLAWVALFAFFCTQMMQWFLRKGKPGVLFPWEGVLPGALTILFVLLKGFVFVSNPFFPAIALQLAPFGPDLVRQNEVIQILIHSIRIDKSPGEIPGHLLNMIFRPWLIQSKYWGWPVFFFCLVLGISSGAGKRRKVPFPHLALLLTVFLLAFSWFWGSPFLRFFMGALILITFWGAQTFSRLSRNATRVFQIMILLTVLVFSGNLAKHLHRYILPFITEGEQATLPRLAGFYTSSKAEKKTTTGGNPYILAGYCYHHPAPCLNFTMMGEPDELIDEYYRNQPHAGR